MLDKPEISDNKIVIPSDPAFISVVDEFLESSLRRRGVAEETVADIAICASEIVNNGIQHGNRLDHSKVVTLELEFSDHEVTVTVTDQGEFFDPEKIADPVAAENLLREVGRGVFIVRQLMDRVEITEADSGGTVVSFTKKIA
ncbi:MAG: ATP-binding protein [bacterium]